MTQVLAYQSADDLSVSIQQIGDDVVMLAKYGRYAPWSTTIRFDDDSMFVLVAAVLRDYAHKRLTRQLRASVEVERELLS